MKKLMIGWGWLFYRHRGLFIVVWILSFISLGCLPVFVPSLFQLVWKVVIYIWLTTMVMFFLLFTTAKAGHTSKNWRVAVDTAQKLQKELRDKIEIETLERLERLTREGRSSGAINKQAEKDLAKFIGLIDELTIARGDVENSIEQIKDQQKLVSELEVKILAICKKL